MNERFCPHFEYEQGKITEGICTLKGRTPQCIIASDWAPTYFDISDPEKEKGMIDYIAGWQKLCSGKPKIETQHTTK